MPTITLPDGKNIKFPKEVTGLDVAEKNKQVIIKTSIDNERRW